MPAQDSKQDLNNFPGLLLVQGTAGTADVGPGTSILMRASGDPLTGAIFAQILGGSINIGTIATFIDNLDGGTLDLLKAGTISRVEGGSIVQTAGTVTTGSLSAVATVGTLQNINGGSMVITNGTIVQNPPSALVAFIGTVAGAGTRVQLANNALINGGILEAPSTNSGLIYVGGTDVSSTIYGAELQPGQSTGIAIDNTNKIYIDASVSGDKAAFIGG